tara:strand:- start:740 stop:1063 length:324 start_codon:yes stop_codon:yes gene_type:complete
MNIQHQRIAIAEACGWTPYKMENSQIRYWRPPQGEQWSHQVHQLPDYLNDLNAMHEAEKLLTGAELTIYRDRLLDIIITQDWQNVPITAKASQRAEAFLRTLDLWID